MLGCVLGAVDIEGLDEVVGTGVGDENTTSNSRSITTFFRRRLEACCVSSRDETKVEGVATIKR